MLSKNSGAFCWKKFACIILLFLPSLSMAKLTPILNFSDIISGPDSGLGDGLGSGVVVTIWGQHLGNTQGNSSIKFKDSANVVRTPHVYYWKRADGRLPGGPADLYSSHGMQEIAISIPDSAVGQGEIFVIVDGNQSTSLPFNIRSGKIYHVKSTGDDINGNGSFNKPWATVDKADSTAEAGSTIYVHGVKSGGPGTIRAVYWNNSAASSTTENQFTITSYPNTQSSAQGEIGFSTYRAHGMVVSKYKVFASHCDDSGGQPVNCTAATGGDIGIEGSAFGRAVGNKITDQPGGCASRYAGAIKGNTLTEDDVSAYKIFGNEIYDYGCNGSIKFHHTTYMSIRAQGADTLVPPWEFGWNYLHGNKAKNGIHNYDENAGCGDTTGPILIHNNVIIDQAGAGISVGSKCDWAMDTRIFNNILINVGLASSWDGIDVSTSDSPDTSGINFRDNGLLGTMYVFNNIIYKWNDDDLATDTRACLGFGGTYDNVRVIWNDNICLSDKDLNFVGAGFLAENKLDNVSGRNNVWYTSSNTRVNALIPSWDAEATSTYPGILLDGTSISVAKSASIINQGLGNLPTDIYGNQRGNTQEIGAVEYAPIPPSPPKLKK